MLQAQHDGSLMSRPNSSAHGDNISVVTDVSMPELTSEQKSNDISSV